MGGRRKAKAFFVALGASMAVGAVALNIGWIVLNWRTGLMLALGVAVFGLIIAGVVLNTIFLVREIRRNEQHDAFINAVTHELKTPVASLKLYLQTLQSRDVPEERRQEFYRTMLSDSDRLLGTIDQVLRAARTASARPALLAQVPVHPLVAECVEAAVTRHHLQPGAVQLCNEAPLNSTVMGDAEELRAAINNLIDNAIKYSGQQVQVSVQVLETGVKHIAVRVTDQGVGIAPGELKRIFKRFYRIPNTMALRVKGTGLGLFIVRSVAERHGGRAWAESEGPGRGSTFTLELPAVSA